MYILGVINEIRFEKIVKQSLESRFIDFKKKAQSANNHSFGNAGGIALALKLFPDSPQADEAKAWLNRIWENLSEFGDWTEWNYYPCLLYTSPSPRDLSTSRMPSSA